MAGILYGIGTGPGNPDELTLNAIKTIRLCDIIFLPADKAENCRAFQTVKEAVPEIIEKQLIFCKFPMTKDENELESFHEKTASQICDLLAQNKNVGFLTIGDPVIYSTYFYIHNKIIEKGCQAKIINGISSVTAVAAKLGINLGEKSDEIHIIPASYSFSKIKELSGTLVFMKSGKSISELKQFLEDNSDKITFLGAVNNCGLENEKTAVKLSDLNSDFDYMTIVIAKAKASQKDENETSHKFFQNKSCKNFPCHKIENQDDFNCLFCFCPLYALGAKCGGNFKYTHKGIKSCIDCNYPHQKENYDKIIARFSEINSIMKS